MTEQHRLRGVPLFATLGDADLDRICVGVTDVTLAAGATLFEEGEHGDAAYIVDSGEVEIVKDIGGRTTLLAKRGAGDVIGEMALLQDEPRTATVRARTACTLLRVPRAVMDGVLATSPTALRSVLATLLERTRETNARLRQTERMAQLGTLTAGVAHELNNPAAGARRAAEALGPAVDDLLQALGSAAVLGERAAAVVDLAGRARPGAPLGGLARSDAETALEDWLDEHDVAEPWTFAPDLVGAGIATGDLETLTAGLDAAGLAAAVRLLARAVTPRRLAHEVGEGTRRISDLVGRLKSHAYLDRGAQHDVDVREGIDDSLALLAQKLRTITVVREYADEVPTLRAAGGELNQVWMNLLDNAADALASSGTPDPRIVVRVVADGAALLVEVEDNGPGIAADVIDRVFDAFFTTKPPGKGTGLGLNLSYEIVTFDHHGELTVSSRPGSTTFRVRLPRS